MSTRDSRAARRPGPGASARTPARSRAPVTRAEAREKSREALISAGLRLFAEQGLDAPSLDAICERAGYTRGAFYVHFEDRDDFLVAVMERAGAEYLDAVLPPLESPNLADTVRRFVASLSAGTYPLAGPSGIKPHQLLDACARHPKIRARYLGLVQDSLRRLGVAIERGQAARLLRGDITPQSGALLLLTGVIGLQTLLELGATIDVAQAAAATLAMLRPAS